MSSEMEDNEILKMESLIYTAFLLQGKYLHLWYI